MSNYKVKVNNEVESREVQGLFFELGYTWLHHGAKIQHVKQSLSPDFGYLIAWSTGCFTNVIQCGCGREEAEELTIPQLRDLVVLKRNSIDDATHECKQDPEFKYRLIDNWWHCITPENKEWRKDSITLEEAPLFIKPISPLKEYLVPQGNGKYALTKATEKRMSDWVYVPDGMNFAWLDSNIIFFTASEMGYRDAVIVWQRHTQPEELPFVDDEPKRTYGLTREKAERISKNTKDAYLAKYPVDVDEPKLKSNEKYDLDYISKISANGENLDNLAEMNGFRDRFIGEDCEHYRKAILQHMHSGKTQSLNDTYAEIEQVRQQSVESTLAERQSTYGDFTSVANTTGQLMAVILNSKNGQTLPYAHEEALHMICSKIARIMNGDMNHKDSWHDIGGYAKLVEDLID